MAAPDRRPAVQTAVAGTHGLEEGCLTASSGADPQGSHSPRAALADHVALRGLAAAAVGQRWLAATASVVPARLQRVAMHPFHDHTIASPTALPSPVPEKHTAKADLRPTPFVTSFRQALVVEALNGTCARVQGRAACNRRG